MALAETSRTEPAAQESASRRLVEAFRIADQAGIHRPTSSDDLEEVATPPSQATDTIG